MNDSSTGPLQIGILGAAKIARFFVEGVRPSAKVQVRAVVSRERWTGSTPDESVDTMLMLEALAASARQGTIVEVVKYAEPDSKDM